MAYKDTELLAERYDQVHAFFRVPKVPFFHSRDAVRISRIMHSPPKPLADTWSNLIRYFQ